MTIPWAFETSASAAEAHTWVQRFKFVQHTQFHSEGVGSRISGAHGIPTLRGAKEARRTHDVEPCPPEKREAIEEAFRHVGMM